ncbi:hypothetical protein [Vibrio sp. B1FLJ16]|uniref:hypothetical protein n=1 Tax=Vibrio sp. B1FLJ16 TaxID=2751178 RepID=UPI0015F73016|nr:hypothetical protein [Vibrio sp. B1FLJ16]CAD7821160.1 hypothetical protein ACOMICROBIO_EPCKBFOG_04008 [Vibrio sp. B1FLJ16]CAE6945466.1 hypothetical protein ACOMICROBIO_EPCKBFOG_04008 [Vibrio sp. B1FLJ16]
MKCLAIKLDGTQCRYRVNELYKPYCGVHKNKRKNELSDKERDERLSRLIQTGVSLILLLEYAEKYLPDFIEMIVSSNTLNFCRRTKEDFDDIEEYSTVTIYPKDVIGSINSDLAEQNLHTLYISLNSYFLHLFSEKLLPLELYADITKKRNDLLALIDENGYKPSKELVEHLMCDKFVKQGTLKWSPVSLTDFIPRW